MRCLRQPACLSRLELPARVALAEADGFCEPCSRRLGCEVRTLRLRFAGDAAAAAAPDALRLCLAGCIPDIPGVVSRLGA